MIDETAGSSEEYWIKAVGIDDVELPHAKNLMMATPTRFSWMGRPQLSAVSDQRPPHQSCFAHAMCRALETRRALNVRPPVRLDADMFHACVIGLPCTVGERNPKRIADALEVTGAPTENGPYRCGDPCPSQLPGLTRSGRVTQARTADVAKMAIAGTGPLVALISAELRFEQVSDFSVYRDGLMPRIYHHALLLIGYDDEAGFWEVQNSYGRGWGQEGRGRIAYGHAGLFSDEFHVAFVVG